MNVFFFLLLFFYWRNPVVRMSVCNAVHCGSQGRCTAIKVVRVVLAGKFPFVPSDTFTAGCIVYPWNAQNESKKARRWVFETDNQACTGRVTFCYSLTSWTLLSHAWVDWVWVRSQTLYPWNRIVRKLCTSRSSTHNRKRFDNLPVYRTS